VLSVTGTDSSDGDYYVAGSLAFDGKGGVTGVADYNLGSGIDDNVPLTGTYTVSGTTASVTLVYGTGQQDTFSAALAKTGAQAVSSFDGTGTGTLTPATGSAFATSGSYTFALSGEGQGAVTSSGAFTVAGNTVASGTQSYTDGGVSMDYASLSGILEPVQANGRGVAAIGGYTFGYYPVSTSSIVLAGTDDRVLLYGTATKQ
jgi:hypothetical protein